MIGLINTFQQILNSIIPILIALGVVYFVWGVVRYMGADGEEARKKGKDTMLYGIIGFTVILGMWGLVNIVVNTFFSSSDLLSPSIQPLLGSSTCSLEGRPKFQDLLCYVAKIINGSIIPLVFVAATLMFVWGVVQSFILNADDAEKRSKGKQFMIWGIVALAVMISVWGLVKILGGTFGIDTSILPRLQPPTSPSP